MNFRTIFHGLFLLVCFFVLLSKPGNALFPAADLNPFLFSVATAVCHTGRRFDSRLLARAFHGPFLRQRLLITHT